jgi:cell division protein FtsL
VPSAPINRVRNHQLPLTQQQKKRRGKMSAIFVVCIVIVIIVLLLSVITTSKAYSYKHTIDPLENNPHLNQEDQPDNTQR